MDTQTIRCEVQDYIALVTMDRPPVNAAPLASPPNATSPRVLRSARGAGPTRRRDRSRPLHALGAGAATPPCAPVRGQGPIFAFFDACRGTDCCLTSGERPA